MPGIPDAYWSKLPWPIGAVIIFMAIVALPWFIAWRKGVTHKQDADTTAHMQRETMLQQRERELYEIVEKQRDDEASAHDQTKRALERATGHADHWREDAFRGWNKARSLQMELVRRTNMINDLRQIISSAKLPHAIWETLDVPNLENVPELLPADFNEPQPIGISHAEQS